MQTLTDKKLNPSDKDNYVNVRTNRTTKNLTKEGLKYKRIGDNYICGTQEEIQQFRKINTKCRRDSVGSLLFVPESDNVEDIPDHIINTMCVFELSGLSGKARVVRILDADTLQILFFVKISELSAHREHGRARGRGVEKKKEMKVPIITQHHSAGFFSLFTCRINSIDAAEHNTVQGQFATLLLEDYIKKLNNIVYIKIEKFDKYGRMLANIYSDKKYTQLISDKLVDTKIKEIYKIILQNDIKFDKSLTNDDLSIIALSYSGDTKDCRFKKLPLVSNNFINRDIHKKLLEKYALK